MELATTSPLAAPSAAPADVSDAAVKAIDQLRSTVQEQAELIRDMETLMSDMDDRLQKLERDLGV